MTKKIWVIFISILLASTIFSYYRLGTSVLNVDGQLWYLRSSAFIKNVQKLKLDKTYQDPKPGVPVMWLSGISSEIFFRIYESKFGFRPDFFVKDSFPLIFTAFVAPLVMVNLLTGVVFFFLVKRLTNTKIALFSYMLLALHPYYTGISRFLHVDSLMTNFMLLSYLFFLLYLKNTKKLNLILSGVLLGLALLTKTQAFFLLPIMFVSYLIDYVFIKKKLVIINFAKSFSIPFVILIAVASFTYYAVFPAMWSKPIKVLSKVTGEAVYVAETGRSTKNVQPFYHYALLLPRVISPSLVLLYFASVVFLIVKRNKLAKDNLATYINLSLFAFMYFIEISVVKQKIDRYLLPLFPFVFISCSIFFSYLKNIKLIFICLFLTLLLTLAYYAPHYAMFGCNNQECNTHGFLYKEVGDYINANTTQKFPSVVTVTKPYALRVFVDGNTYWHEDGIPKNVNIDFFVTNDFFIEDRGIPKAYKDCVFWHRVSYHSIPEWDIYKCR